MNTWTLTVSSWGVRESCEFGRETRKWELRREGLSVGRSSDCDVQLQSQTVEERHAVFEWDSKREVFVVRDLGSVNGTYVNNRPLRGGHTVLKHGDSLRFGYEKVHLFRVEVTAAPPPPPPPATPPSHSTVVATQTSPLEEQMQYTSLPPATQPAVSVQYVPIPSQSPTIIIPTMQPAMPYVVPQQAFAYNYPPVSPSPLTPTPLTPTPLHPPPPGNLPVSSAHTLQQNQAATPTSATPTSATPTLAEDIETLSLDTLKPSSKVGTPRRDGRRAVCLLGAPNLSKGSVLYGQPSWWGEEGGSDPEPELGHQGSRLLRDLSPERRREHKRSAPVRTVHSWSSARAEDGLRKQAISNSLSTGQKKDDSSTASWVIDFGSGQHRQRSFTSRRPRSADPSPTRTGRTASFSKRSVSPARSLSHHTGSRTTSRTKDSSSSAPSSPRHGGGKSDNGGKKKEGIQQKKAVSKKPPAGSKQGTRRSTLTSTPTKQSKSTVRVKPIPSPKFLGPEHSIPETKSSVTPPSATQDQKGEHNMTYSVTPPYGTQDQKGEHDMTYTMSHPSTKDSSPVSEEKHQTLSSPSSATDPGITKRHSDTAIVVRDVEERRKSTEEERPGSARKQWSKDQTKPPDSLMLASIEARLRRLNKMAQRSAIGLSSLLPTMQQRGAVEGGGNGGGGGEGTPGSRGEQELPEWKFFNKDVDSIFRNIRGVEKWLRDIDTTVVSLQMEGEDVDYHQDLKSSDSEAATFEDSIEDLIDSHSDVSSEL